jgi:predicted transcriptional regulator
MAALPGGRKTHIMFQSGLNLKQLNLYLGELLAHGALEYRPADKLYVTTEKGKLFAKVFDQYREAANQLNKEESALAHFFPSAVRKNLAAS